MATVTTYNARYVSATMTIALYPPIVMENDLAPEHFGAEIDEICQSIDDATRGWGANKQKVIDALATQDATARTKISIRFKELYNKELPDLMEKEFSGDFGLTLKFLSMPSDKAECAMLKAATRGVGANANIVWSIVCGRTNAEIERLKKVYFQTYERDLGQLLAKELTGNMERLVFNCLQAAEEEFNPQFHTIEKAAEDAEFIHDKGQGRWGTDEKSIFKIVCASPKEHLERVNKIYADKYGYTLLKAMEKELGGMGEGKVREATLHLVSMKLKPFEAIAELIKSACAGVGTDELLLTCCIIRYQPVMSSVMAAHIELFGKTVHDRVRKEAGGKYKHLLLQILNTAWPEQG